jgi:acetyl-CoA carboxylase carboxyl transferase subunit alpha
MARSKAGSGGALAFERPILDVIEEVAGLRKAQEAGKVDVSRELRAAEDRAAALTREIFSQLTPWQRVQLARHANRPLVNHYLELLFTELTELHGDRYFGDDPAIVTALARIDGRRVMVVGHRKGRDVKEKVACHFGMANPEGYRKALRKMKLAERFGLPIVALIDTPGANPDIGAEERGQAWAIAENIQDMTGLAVPIVAAVVGEGGSGGALGIGVGDRVLMMEYAYYSVISPEGCAAILWKTSEKASDAAAQLRLTATDLERLGIVDEIVPEPLGGAHRNPAAAAASLKQAITRALDHLAGVPVEKLLDARYEKFRRIGAHLFGGMPA